jgi:predicted permease
VDAVNALLSVGLKMLAGGAIGYWVSRRRIVGDRFGVDVNNLLLAIVVPCATLASASAEFSASLVRELGAAALVSGVYFAVAWPAMALVGRALPWPAGDRRMFPNLAVMANVGFIGLPVASELFGPPGMLCAVVVGLAYNLVMFTVGTWWLAAGEPLSLRAMATNPPLVASVVAIGLFFAPFRIPEAVQGALDMVAGLMTPLAMMIVGLSLAQSYLPDVVRSGRGFAVCAVRLLVLPAAVWAVTSLAGLHGLGVQVAILLSALPCGTLNVILGARYGTGYRLALDGVVQSNILMFATLPAVLLVLV